MINAGRGAVSAPAENTTGVTIVGGENMTLRIMISKDMLE